MTPHTAPHHRGFTPRQDIGGGGQLRCPRSLAAAVSSPVGAPSRPRPCSGETSTAKVENRVWSRGDTFWATSGADHRPLWRAASTRVCSRDFPLLTRGAEMRRAAQEVRGESCACAPEGGARFVPRTGAPMAAPVLLLGAGASGALLRTALRCL